MEKKHAKTAPRLWVLIGCCGAVLLALITAAILMTVGGGKEEPAPQGPVWDPSNRLILESVDREPERVIVTTSYCVVEYPGVFSDVIRVGTAEHDGFASLEFFVHVDGSDEKMFAIIFNGDEGSLLGHIRLAEGGEAYPVYAVHYEADAGMSADGRATFLAARECFNDVQESLKQNGSFTPAP